MINARAFREYTNQSRPFSIHLADGRAIRVSHGEHIALHPDGQMLLSSQPGGGFELFNLTMGTSIKGSRKKSSVAAS